MKDNKRKLECDMFTELNSTIQNFESNSENSQNILLKLTELLDKLLNDNIYQAKNDDISRQHREILEKITSHIISIANFKISDNYPLIFNLLNILLQIEYIIVLQDIDSLWRIIFMSQVEPIDNCIELLKRLLEICAKSRKMDLYIQSLLSVLSNIQVDAHIILRSPLFCTVILDEFSDKVANNVSKSQAIEIIALFTSEMFCLPEFLEQSNVTKKSTKRRKLDETDTKIMKIIEPLSLLIGKFLRALRIAASFKDELEKEFQTMFDQFIHPILSYDYGDKDKLLYRKMTYAALSLHHVLVDISIAYWKNISTPSFVNILLNIALKDPKSILFLNKVRLQHVYQLMKYQCDITDMNDVSDTIMHKLVDSVMFTLKEPENPDVTWTGRLVDLNDKNFAVANCMIILGDWLDVVSNMCQEHYLASIVRFIINYSSISSQHLKEISVETLCLQCLRSAEFFELRPLRDIFVRVYLEEISKCFQHIRDVEMSNENKKELDLILLISLQDQQSEQSEKSNLLDVVMACFNESVDTINQKTCFSLTSINKITKYCNLLHLFPMEYFTKQEISNLSLLILLIDRWVLSIKTKNDGEISDIIKCSILCRSLICKFVSYTNRKDDFLKKDASFIIWWISSINVYQKYIISCTNGLGHDDIKVIQNLFENFTQITCHAVTIVVRQVLISFQDDDVFKTNYLNRIVDYFKNLIDDTLSKKKDSHMSSNATTWKFAFEFLKLGIEFAESRKKSKNFQFDYENAVYRSFLTLRGIVEKNLNSILSDILDQSIQEIQNSNDSNDLEWKEKLSIELAHYDNELKAYKICLQYYHLYKNSELEVTREALNMMSLLSKILKITTLMLRTSPLEVENAFDKEVVLRQCVTLLSIVIDFIHIIEYEFNENILIDIFILVCDLMKIFHNEDSNSELTKELNAIFNSIISRLSNERYDIIANTILTKLEVSSFSSAKNTNGYDIIFQIHLIDVFLHNSNYGQLRRLEQKLPNLLCGICGIAALIDKVTHGIQILRILKFLICHRAFSFQSMDIGLVLSVVISLTSPKRHYKSSEEREFKELFEEICYLLNNLLIHRREQLISTLPTFIFIIQSMFHCFKKTHKSFKINLKEMRQKGHQGRYISWWEVHLKNPLPIESANIFTRLLTTINKKSGKSGNKNNNNKAYIKHIPSLLSEYIEIQTKNNILDANVRDVLKNGIYSLLELCGQFERDMIMVGLDLVGKSLFKSLWIEYNKEWKYVGRG